MIWYICLIELPRGLILIWMRLFWTQVREQYHMETFVTMITGFDPAVGCRIGVSKAEAR